MGVQTLCLISHLVCGVFALSSKHETYTGFSMIEKSSGMTYGDDGCNFKQEKNECTNVITCARLCSRKTACEYLQYDDMKFQVSRENPIYCGEWTRFYSRNATHAFEENGTQLYEFIKKGYDIIIVSTGGRMIKYNTLAAVYSADEIACVQTQPYVNHATGKWQIYWLCSHGLQSDITASAFGSYEVETSAFDTYDFQDWYVKRSDCVTQATTEQVEELVKTGQHVVLTGQYGDDMAWSRKATNIIQVNPLRIVGQANVLKADLSTPEECLNLSYPLQWSQSTTDLTDVMETVTCKVGDVEPCSTQSTPETLKWMIHQDWYKIYENDAAGSEIYGNLCNFKDKFESNGKRIRVGANGIFFEPDLVFIHDDHVFAMSSAKFSTSTTDETGYTFRLVSTKGTLETAFVSYGSGAVSITKSTSSVVWFVEHSSWNAVFNSYYSVQTYSAMHHVKNAKRFRIMFEGRDLFPDYDETRYIVFANIGSIIADDGSFEINGFVKPFLDISVTSSTMGFRESSVALWRIVKLYIQPQKHISVLMHANRTHGDNSIGDEYDAHGHIMMFIDGK